MSTEHGAATAANGGDRNGGAEASVTATDDNDGQAAPYQLLPALSEAEYAALRESIAEHGVRVPIEVDEDGNILDGHHRAAIAADLGIDCPRVVVSNLDTEQDKRTVALMLNLSRRHLTREQKREVVRASIAADPDLSDREHARRCGVSPTTVGTVRREVSKLDSPEPVTGDRREEFERMTAEIDKWLADLRHWLNLCYVLLVRHGMPEQSAWHLGNRVWSDCWAAMLAPDDAKAAATFETARQDLMQLVRVTAGGAR